MAEKNGWKEVGEHKRERECKRENRSNGGSRIVGQRVQRIEKEGE